MQSGYFVSNSSFIDSSPASMHNLEVILNIKDSTMSLFMVLSLVVVGTTVKICHFLSISIYRKIPKSLNTLFHIQHVLCKWIVGLCCAACLFCKSLIKLFCGKYVPFLDQWTFVFNYRASLCSNVW